MDIAKCGTFLECVNAVGSDGAFERISVFEVVGCMEGNEADLGDRHIGGYGEGRIDVRE